MLWIQLLFRKRKFKVMLLLIGILTGTCYLLTQFIYLLLLNEDALSNLVSRSSSGHKPNVAINKILSKWNDSKHSKIVKDKDGNSVSLRGTHIQDITKYLPNKRGKFVCITSRKEIDFLKINDDYCDCPLDGSDEPGTNACNNGTFYCEVPSKKFSAKIPSYKVNDGVCDCCDGCDEWSGIPLLDKTKNNEQNGQQSLCPNRC